MKNRILLTLLSAALLLCTPSNAQDFSNKGKDFWVGYGYHQVMTANNAQQMVLYFATDVLTTVTVEIPLLGYKQTYPNIPANTIFTSNPLPKSGVDDARLLTEGVSKAGIHITSDRPIVAYTHIYNASVSGATLLFPTPTLGKEYYSVNYTQVSNSPNSNCWVYAIAVDPGTTTVEVVPSAATIGRPANVPFTVNLQQGEILNLMGALTTTAAPFRGVDLTGTKVRSVSGADGTCKRIAVFSGSGRISLSCNGTAPSSDNYIVQAFPKNAWGRKYLTAPTSILPNNFYRICVLDPATVVRVNGTVITGLTGGFYYEISTDQPSVIEATNPIMVAQVMTSQGQCGNGTPGDPEIIYLSPVEQNIDKVIFNSTSNFGITQHFINVVIKASAVATFKLDGVPAGGAFSPHPREPAYVFAQINVTAGQHTLSADSGFNAIAYGLGPAESYGYNAGTNVKDLFQFVSIQNQFATVNFPASCVNTPFFFSMTFPYQPSEIKWVFNGLFPDVTVPSPVFDSTWVVNGKQLYRYKLVSAYSTPTVGTYPIKVLAQSPTIDGCGSEQEINYDLQIFEQPTANFNFTTNGCVTTPVAFTDQSLSGGRPTTQWTWDFGDNTTGNTANPSHTFASPGSFQVKLKIVTDIGCISNTAVKTVDLSQPPTARFSAAGPYCQRNPVIFTNESTAPVSPITQWTWNFGDGTPPVITTSGNAQAHVFANPGNYTVTLLVETASGCKSAVYSQLVAVGAKPEASFTAGNGCLPNAAIQFTSTSTINGAPGTLTYAWTFGDGATSTLQNPSHTYTTPGPFPVSLVVTTSTGCTDDTLRTVNNIFAQPVANFSTSKTESCTGEAITFTDSQSLAAGSTLSEWTWNFGDGSAPVSAATGVAQTHAYTTPGTFTATLSVKSSIGCTSQLASRQVVVLPPPVANFSASPLRCAGSSILFTSTSTANGATVNGYSWSVDGAVSGSGPSFTFTPVAARSYVIRLSVTTDKGCKSADLDSTIIVNELPTALFGLPENCVEDPLSQFTDSSSVTSGTIASWLWNFGDPAATPANPNTSSVRNGSHKYTLASAYDVSLTVTSNNGCTATTTNKFTINGSLPTSSFSVANGTTACSNSAVTITSNSGVDLGKIVKLEVFWDDANDPLNKITDNDPKPGQTYNNTYPAFTSPASKSFKVRVRAFSGDLCFDDSVTTITVHALPDVTMPPVPQICTDSSAVQVSAFVTNLGGNGLFTGKGVSPSGRFNPAVAGVGSHTIRYTFTSTAGCVSFAEQVIKVLPVPSVDAGPSMPLGILEGGTLVLPATASGGNLRYSWSPSTWLSSSTVLRPIASPLRDTLYQITVTNGDGCTASDSVRVQVLKGITIPNVFTPNGDGVNDRWDITYLESYAGAIIQVYNRYGQLIYQSKGYSQAWDGTVNGKPVPFGTYYYVIDPKNNRKPITGFVDIIR